MRRKKKSPLPYIVVLIVLLVIAGGAGLYLYSEGKYKEAISQKAGGGNTPHTIEVSKGTTVSAVANILKEKNLIVDRDAFVRFAKEKGDDRNLHAGSFSVTSGLTTPEVLDILTGRTEPSRMRITIPEGLTIREIATLLVKQGVIKDEKELYSCIASTCDFSSYTFLPPKTKATYAFDHSYMEGYLFPDTYFIDTADFSLQQFVGLMLKTFDTKVQKGLAKEIAASSYDLEDLIIMASIVEKESRPRDNQALVAGVLWKRFENGVQLAADATNRYIKANPTDPITVKELVSLDPYNGRKVKGLPPSAISNPGLASIEAAISPEESAWWYYLHDANGAIHFARTENEHERNKSLYLD